MKLNLLVIRTKEPQLLAEQYKMLGLSFDYHKHGNGPFHFASEVDGFVFEIYPLTKSMDKADGSLRMGFEVDNLHDVLDDIKDSDWKITQEIKETEWGLVAVIQDLDGRKIELKNR
ncbi:VOC family protein [Flammeovirga sp. EKP202]|uniref:VOC family protein n=1 Tax=Flammeovirga sp. EKP202 TaxID=2770592 RepID=UPI00165EF9B2|nr:glyoxalase/bleomycin resistance/extradiol dioxygenase family protein [Flammeovirga sp. EKP202]MBD0404978.1 glyoxalase/bleomycin resistance/extradiol dioxygenase family protein [Flammeovirga sp. EKP202]